MALDPLHRDRQIKAIERELATAPDIQEDLKTKFGYGENKFFDLDLMEYRINNSALDIAEDLDLEERYGLINDQPINSVGRAFRGHHHEEFMPDYQFDGLFGKVTYDIIKGIRKKEFCRKGLEAQGFHVWSLEEIADIHNFREESIGKGYRKNQPSWDYVTSKMNENYDEDWTTNQVTRAYQRNKHLLSDEEE